VGVKEKKETIVQNRSNIPFYLSVSLKKKTLHTKKKHQNWKEEKESDTFHVRREV